MGSAGDVYGSCAVQAYAQSYILIAATQVTRKSNQTGRSHSRYKSIRASGRSAGRNRAGKASRSGTSGYIGVPCRVRSDRKRRIVVASADVGRVDKIRTARIDLCYK